MTRTCASLAALVVAGLAACDLGSFDPSDGGVPAQDRTTCAASCHGSDGVAAPPRDTSGGSDPSTTGVGAHRAHLGTSGWHKRLECTTCHQVPQEIGEAGHIDTALPAELTFGGLGAGSTWNGTSCTSYCHGAGLTGGTTTQPAWTAGDGAPDDCGSCHGAPPPSPHPQDGDCATCHPTMNPGGGMTIAYPELHIDGHLDVINAAACDSCHGSAGDPAPPKDTTGATATSARGVGAHQAHLGASTWHATLDCAQCHQVPAGISDLGHVDTPLPAELTFGGLAGSATWNGTTCAGSYCHGATLTGGNRTAPEWTRVDGSQSQCGSCHGAPPPPPHPSNSDCGVCHPTMIAGGGLVIAYPALHLDGNVDVIGGQACDACHGSGGNPAPPRDTTGGTATTLRTVGAHRRHLDPSTWHKDIACSECHRVPGATTAIGHMDTPAPAEVTFGALAGAAAWNGNSCTNSYCHGATLAGGTATTPVWTQVDGSQGQCGSCHGTPPPPPHPVNDDCGACHPTMTAGQGLVITDPARHIDGNVDVTGAAACDSCHGSGGEAAPPRDNAGNTATTARGVGAHRAHLGAGARSAAIVCTDCHRVPGAVDALGHRDTPLPAELTFSARAGTATAWNGSRCSNNYCHGATLAGGTNTAPIWNQVGAGQASCGACHGLPPPPPHPAQGDCGTCHDTMTPGNNTTITDPARHIDGNLDVTDTQACDSCHGSGGVSAPPRDTTGNTATTARGVGAHRAHLGPSTWHATLDCAQCHRVPTGVTTVGHTDTALPAELTFTSIALGTTWNGTTCGNSYCHGATLAAGGTATAPQWTRVDGSQAACGACHGTPPPAPHPADTQCENCHAPVAGPGMTIATPAMHIDGTLQVSSVHPTGWAQATMHGAAFNSQGPASCATASCHGTALTGGASNVSCNGCHTGWQTSCVFCHGGGDNATGAPPASVTGITAPSDRHVGAHTAHVTGATTHAAYACSACHVTPSTALTAGHIDGAANAEVRYSSMNPAGTYSVATAGCATLYCHGNGRTSAGTATWTSTTNLGCSACHNDGSRPDLLSGKHKKHIADERMQCGECHQTVVSGNSQIIGPALHVNALKEVKMTAGGTWNPSTRSCSGLPGGACHGTERW